MNSKTIRWGWANVYKANRNPNAREVGRHIFDTEDLAKAVGRLYENYVTTLRVE